MERRHRTWRARLAGAAAACALALTSVSAFAAEPPQLIAWGYTSGYGLVPAEVPGIQPVALSAGGAHHLVLAADGTVWGFGDNQMGQLGDGTFDPPGVPVPPAAHHVVGLDNVVAVAGGMYHSLALRADGSVWAWGSNLAGELGNGLTTNGSYVPGSLVPIKVTGVANVIAIAAGTNTSFALTSDGSVWAWGFNGGGQLGLGTSGATGDGYRTAPARLTLISNVTAISARDAHTIVRKSDGTVWTWGWNGQGQLGTGPAINSPQPRQVPGITDAVAVTAGYNDSFVVRADGAVLAWGANLYGQLGDGTTTQRLSPVTVPGLDAVTAMSATYGHTLALRADGSVWSWGGGWVTGLPTFADQYVPVRLEPISAATAVATDGSMAMVIGAVTPPNVAPTLTMPPTVYAEEGTTATASGSFDDVNVDQDVTLTASVGTITKSGTNSGTWSWSMPTTDGPTESQSVFITADDGHGGVSIDSFLLGVMNVAPVITDVNWPTGPIAAGAPITVTAHFTDVSAADVHTCTLEWGDGTIDEGTVIETAGTGLCTSTHVYQAPGVQFAWLTLFDKGDAAVTWSEVVTYDASAGWVSGVGSVDSPIGACRIVDVCQDVEGPARFGFFARPGRHMADGDAGFLYATDAFYMLAIGAPELVVSGPRATYTGTATVNEQPGFRFVLTVTDGALTPRGGPDRLRLQIYRGRSLVYDNSRRNGDDSDDDARLPAISSGDIVIHRR